MNPDKIETQKSILLDVDSILDNAYNEHDAFNKEFHKEDQFKFISSQTGNKYKFERSEVLFKLDREAYYEELNEWSNVKTKGSHDEVIELLKRENGLNVFMELVSSIKRNRIAPFVGAGLSAHLDYPLWGKALKEIVQRLEGLELEAVQKLIDAYQYLEAAEILMNKDDTQFINYINDRFSFRRDWEEKDIMKSAIQLLPEIADGCVITTNYDKVIEKVYDHSKKSFEGFMYGTQQKNRFVTDLLRGDRCLLKLHGNVGEPENYILTLSQYNEAYGSEPDFSKALPKTLRQIFISHSLLFLGCSMEQDRTLDLFKAIKEEEQFEIPEHYAILPKPSTAEEKRAKENRLLQMNIKTIWYPEGEHDFVEKLLKLAIDTSKGVIKI